MKVQTLYWKNGAVYVLDQLLLPKNVKYIRCGTFEKVASVIKKMNIRGAPAIGIAAAYGYAVAFRGKKFDSIGQFQSYLKRVTHALASTRPTAINLFWACERMENIAKSIFKPDFDLGPKLIEEACLIHKQDIEANMAMGNYGQSLLKKHSQVITHCNAGALATGGYGTALGVIYSARKNKKIDKVFVDETRPYLQGARLSAWELIQNKVPCQLITDNMAGYLMKIKNIDACIIGADRVVQNGDTANKIGSYALAVLAKYHNIPFYVACPSSTFDLTKKTGSEIPVEERSREEVVNIKGISIAPDECDVWHPAFDVTPNELISAIITEKGIIRPPFMANIKKIISA